MRTSLLLLMTSAALAQPSGFVMGGSGDLTSSGIVVRFRTMVEPPTNLPEMRSFGGGVSDGKQAVQRYMWNDSIYFGYDVAVSRTGAGDYQVAFLPSSISPQRTLGKALTAAPQPRFPAPQIIHDGDTIALDLFVSPDGKHKIVDYIQILSPERAEPQPAGATGEPRDFTIDDVPVKFDIGPRMSFWIDGRKFDGESGFTGKAGATFWVYFPGHPRYILSLAPAPGFEKAGAVLDNTIQFAADGHQYEIRFSGPLAGAGNAFNLYMTRDPQYQPGSGRANAISTGTDRLENLVGKR